MKTARKSLLSIGGRLRVAFAATLICTPVFLAASAQEPAQEADRPFTAAAVIPQQVRYFGKLAVRAGEIVQAEFRIYAAQEGGEPLWTETQQVPIALDGDYSVLLGAASSKGLPQTVFAGGAARWLGISVERSPEQERVLLSSVPYAMKSADAESLAGHAASDFVTQEQLAALAISAPAASPGAQPQGSGPITGVGTTGNVALFTGANTIGNSDIVQVGSDIGINVTTPATLLDVGGATTVRGTLDLPAPNLATASGGSSSPQLEFGASSYSSTLPGPVAQNFVLETTATGNNTATPSALLQVLFGSGSTNPSATGLSISPNGHINFASGQPFPFTGTVTGITTTSPLTGNGSSGSIALGFSTSALETTLNTVYPQLIAANTFHSSQTIDGGLTTTSGITTSGVVASGVLQAVGGFLSNNSVQMKNPNVATATTGYNSPVFEFVGSAYNSLTSAAVNQYFSWQALISGNDTSTPTANLALLAGSGSTQSPTGFSISEKGIVTFVSGQTFPGAGGGSGTITGITTTSPLTGSGTSGSVALGLNESALVPAIQSAMATAITPTLETTFNGAYAQLGASNTFTGASNSFTGPVSTASTSLPALEGVGTSGAYGVFGVSDTGTGLIGNSQGPAEGAAGIIGYLSGVTSPSFSTIATVGTGGVWGDANGAPGGADWGAGIIGTASTAVGYGGVFYNSSTIKPTILAENASSGDGISAISTGGSGVVGNSTTADGLVGYSTTPALGDAGVFGHTSTATSSSYGNAVANNNLVAGVWGDTTGNPTNPGGDGSAGIVGTSTAILGYGGYFLSSSPYVPVIEAQNSLGPGLSSTANGNGGDGVDGTSNPGSGGAGAGGNGVMGYAVSPQTGLSGVFGLVYYVSNTYLAVRETDPGYVAGVWGDAGTAPGGAELYKSGIVGTGDDITAGLFENNSPAGHPTLSAVSLYTGTTQTLFKSLMAGGPDGVCGFGSGGDMNCTGRVKALVSVGGGERKVETYSVQSPESWMEDFGTGELKLGVAVVKIDPAFAETVAEDASYHVFITPNGDAEALYVINKTATGFEVRESKGGTSSLTFDYRIVAKRRGYEAERLTDVTERFKAEKAQAMPPVDAGAAHNPRPPRPSLVAPEEPAAHETPRTPAAPPIPGTPRTQGAQRALPLIHPAAAKVGAGHPEPSNQH